MGGEANQEQAKAEAKIEDVKEEKTEKAAEKKGEPKPPSPFVLFIDLHCVGCAKKIEKSILRIKGVEGVVIDREQNQVTVKGVVEPQAICKKIMKKTKRKAEVVSPVPAAEVVASQVSGLTTVELNVAMHCEACSLQLKRKILGMKEVRTVGTELSSGKVTVTGTMDPIRLIDYVYRRTKKQAKMVPQPEPVKPQEAAKPEDQKKEAEKPIIESKREEKKEEAAVKKDGGEKPPGEEKKQGSSSTGDGNKTESKRSENKEEAKKEGGDNNINDDEQRMLYYYHQPPYLMDRIPPPSFFSDENPNACCIS